MSFIKTEGAFLLKREDGNVFGLYYTDLILKEIYSMLAWTLVSWKKLNGFI